MTLEQLKEFRTSVYNILGKAKDALFDLMDAALITRSISAFVELALSPVFRRKWSSVYEQSRSRSASGRYRMEIRQE